MNNDIGYSFNKLGARLSVVVCTFNRAQLLQNCLQSLVEQTLPDEWCEILVIDNNSTDNTPSLVGEFCRRHRQIRYLLEKNQGLSYARNRGWSEASGEFVAYLDDDATAVPDWCERILGAFDNVKPRPAAVGGPILPRLNCRPPWWYSPRLETRSWGEVAGFLHSPQTRFGFSGSNMTFPREVLYNHAGFNTDLGMCGKRVGMGEETDLFFRIHAEEPFFWYDPAIRVHHLVSSRQLKLHSRIYRAFQAGRSRREVEQSELTTRMVLNEMISVVHTLKDLLRERHFNLAYVVVSFLERVANRVGYVSAS